MTILVLACTLRSTAGHCEDPQSNPTSHCFVHFYFFILGNQLNGATRCEMFINASLLVLSLSFSPRLNISSHNYRKVRGMRYRYTMTQEVFVLLSPARSPFPTICREYFSSQISRGTRPNERAWSLDDDKERRQPAELCIPREPPISCLIKFQSVGKELRT
jgi:hypothetical protein